MREAHSELSDDRQQARTESNTSVRRAENFQAQCYLFRDLASGRKMNEEVNE